MTPCLPEYRVPNFFRLLVLADLSSYCFLIYDKILWNRNCWCSSTDWKPFDGVLVVKGPWGDYGEERESGATESDVNRELDVLQEVSDEEGDGLDVRC
jgi:hypothetical protein